MLQNNKDICQLLAKMKGTSTNYMLSDHVDLCNMSNVHVLKELQDVKESIDIEENPMFIKQRTEEWFQVCNLKKTVLFFK